MSRLIRVLSFLSYAYIVFIVASAVSSALVPNVTDLVSRDAACYWTNVMVIYVECDAALFASVPRMLFFNFWMFFIYAPFIAYSEFLPDIIPGLLAGLISVVLYAPIIFLGWRVISRWIKKRRA